MNLDVFLSPMYATFMSRYFGFLLKIAKEHDPKYA